MTTQASDLRLEQRKRIVKAWKMDTGPNGHSMYEIFAALIDVHPDTIRLVISEAEEGL